MTHNADLVRRYDVSSREADPDRCPVVTGMATNFFQDILVCNRPMPCAKHPFPNGSYRAPQ